ncbi:unnamed protein product [Rhizophagus irregularis]|uniref:Uncharacterized protein n=1 Tax=Rhizophagus irregularis TaxID=588596 RepID=A0A2N1NWA2_9GLOM|nr:hypothetical protein RhiirC2_770496 [Rhizophagus irregularis]CAB5395139.1 unnamed protein product [Rhizophagus irregularis]
MPQFYRHQWTYIEEILLILLVILLGRNLSNWRRISRLLNRSVFQCRRRYYEIINQDSGSARRIRRRVNQRVSQGLRPIALERLLHRILLAQQNNTISRDPRMDLSHILNTSRDLSTSNSSHDSRDPRMNLSHILNTFRDSRMNLNHILNSSQDPRMNLNFILNNSLNHG